MLKYILGLSSLLFSANALADDVIIIPGDDFEVGIYDGYCDLAFDDDNRMCSICHMMHFVHGHFHGILCHSPQADQSVTIVSSQSLCIWFASKATFLNASHH